MYSLLFFFAFIPYVQNSRILGVFLHPSTSHQKFSQTILRDLSLRGHEVTILTTRPLNNPHLSNLTEIDLSFTHNRLEHGPKHFLSKEISRFEDLHNMYKYVDFFGTSALNHPNFKNFISSHTDDFDLIMLECYHPALTGLSQKFNAPIVCVSSFGSLTTSHDVVGNPSHPTLYREFFLINHEKNLGFLDKTEAFLLNVWSRLWCSFVILPNGQKQAKSIFGDGIGDVVELQNNIRMFFLNVNPVLYDLRPNVPAVVELGVLEIKPKESLPEDLLKFLDGAKTGAVYCSLGTIIRIEGSSIAKTILEGLAKLPYRVVITWKCDTLAHDYGNILCKEWVAQTNVLAHSNVKVFVSHGGLHSVEEAIIAGVPLVALPFMADQPMNTYKLAQRGIGKKLDPATLTPDQLKNCVVEVVENSSYSKRIQEVRKILLDKPISSLEKVIWWMEYIIRNKGAPHLRSLNLDISWFSYLLGDVIIIWIAVLMFILMLVYSLVLLLW